MATMKENKGKEVVDEAAGKEVPSQPRPIAGDKRKSLSVGVDLGNLPSRRGKKAKHRSSKPKDVQSTPFILIHEPEDVQILDDLEFKDSPI